MTHSHPIVRVSENNFDTLSTSNCEIIAEMGFCENDPNVFEQCAGTCNIQTDDQPAPGNVLTFVPN